MLKHRKLLALILVSLLVVALAGTALAQGNTVEVGLTEFAINMPDSLPAGQTTFQISNNGSFEHNLTIEGQGISQTLETNLQAGESGTLTVDLVPGTYDVYCPVPGHREQGMELQLTVTEAQMEATAEPTEEAMMEGTAEPTEEAMMQATEEATMAATEEAMMEGTAEATMAATEEAMMEATPTPAVETLPETGGVTFPWLIAVVAGLGALLLISGLGLAFSRRN